MKKHTIQILDTARNQNKNDDSLKRIQLCKIYNTSEKSFVDTAEHPSKWDHITLIDRNFCNDADGKYYDLIFACSKQRGLYLGHWNEGEV